jgi:monoamine oxidase
MSRTPLFREVRRTLRLAARLEADRLPTAEGLERLAARTRSGHWTRRRFLTATGLAAGALAVPRLARPARAAAGSQVVIVGAGAAGLTCAYRLQQHGVEARVIEAGTRVGGRMYSLRNRFPDGQTTELGGEFIDSDHTALLALASELGLAVDDLAYVGGTSGNVFAFEGRLIRHDNQLLEAFRPLAAKILEEIGPDGEHCEVRFDHATAEGRELDATSLAEWLSTRGFTGLIAEVLKVAYLGEYGLEPQEQSALNLLCLVGAEPPPVEIYGESDERFHLAGGNDALPQRLAQRLSRPVELGTRLEAIRAAGSGYELTVSRGAGRDAYLADAVVLAIPFTLLRQVDLQVELPQAKRRAIAELGYGTNAKLICGFGKRVWTEAGATGAVFTDLGFQACWETSRGQAGTHGILTNFLGGTAGARLHEGASETHAKRFTTQLDKVFPGAGRAATGQAVRFTWPAFPLSLGSYSCYRPGQYAAIRGAEGFTVGGLHFCGEHTSLRYGGFMNGAVESGERVARKILD